MPEGNRRRSVLVVLIILILLILALLLLLTQCRQTKPTATARQETTSAAPAPSTTPPQAPTAEEVLTPATLEAPQRVTAGAAISVGWKGPDNRGDFVTIVRPDAAQEATGNYRETREGPWATMAGSATRFSAATKNSSVE